jgi:hypothetical protein
VIAERLTCALAQHGHLDVLDFGGALGSLYFQHRSYFSNLEAVQWCVVEQREFVTEGLAHVADGCLRFYESIEACCKECNPAIGIASSALQYLPNPRRTSAAAACGNARHDSGPAAAKRCRHRPSDRADRFPAHLQRQLPGMVLLARSDSWNC